MSVADSLLLSPEDYFHGELKHEYFNGEVWAMVGASDARATITGNLFFLLKQFLKDKPCRTYISDMKVNAAEANTFIYPDILVTLRRARPGKQSLQAIPVVYRRSAVTFDRGGRRTDADTGIEIHVFAGRAL